MNTFLSSKIMLCETINESRCYQQLSKQVWAGCPDMGNHIEFNFGFILTIIVFFIIVMIWGVKYRLRYLLRICLSAFTSSLVSSFLSYIYPYEDISLQSACNLILIVSGIMFFLILRIRYYWYFSTKTVMICFSASTSSVVAIMIAHLFTCEEIPILTPVIFAGSHMFRNSGIMCIFMLIFRYYCDSSTNTVLDCTGFNHLEGIARNRHTTVKKLSTELLKHRDPGELNPVYVNGWIPLIESQSVPKGETATVVAIGYKFCIYRGDDGRARVIDAYCPHMGADLSAGGKVIGNEIQCPFHGWRFCGDSGKCTGIPYSDKVPDAAKTKVWESCEKNGTIFVWHHADGNPPDWELPWIPEIQSRDWICRGRSELLVHCHIQEIPENGADINHLPHVHSRFVAMGPSLVSGVGSALSHDWKPQWEPDKEYSHRAKARIKQQLKINSSWNVPWTHIDVDIEQIGPAAVHLHIQTQFGRGVMLQYITSEGPLKQRIVHTFYTEPGFRLFPAFILIWGETVMIQRDIAVWNNKKFLKNPVLVKEDKLISSFRRWYSQFYSEHSPTLKEARQKTLEW